MSDRFDPFAPGAGEVLFTGRPFRAARAAADGEAATAAGRPQGTAGRPLAMPERLVEIEDRLALLEAGLAQLDRKVAARLDEQMARIVLAVAELMNQRNGRPSETRPKKQAWPKIDW